MQRHAFIKDFGLKPFPSSFLSPETTCPSHSPCSQFYINRVVDEGEPQGYGNREGIQ